MEPVPLSSKDIETIRDLVDQACSDPDNGLPCASISLVGDGRHYERNLLEYGRSSKQNIIDPTGHGHQGDEIYWLASCTKLVTAIACMQLVETGALHLDDEIGRAHV